MNNKRTIKALAYLYRIVEAGEKGYAVSAANVDNLGLKILFKSYAQQRARFKDEILAEIRRMGSNIKPRSSIRGLLHRGRIDIFAALSIGKDERERVVLKEVTLGEKVALRAYQKTRNMELPFETRKIILRQDEEVRRTAERVQLMKGVNGSRLIVRLFETDKEEADALEMLADSPLQLKDVESINVDDSLELYEGRGTTILETSVSGAVGGGLWGSLIGALAATSMEQATHSVPFGQIQSPDIWSLIVFAAILGGAFIGLIIGYSIGVGISGQDSHSYSQTMEKTGQILLLALVENSQASELHRILTRISLKSAIQIEETTA